ncbi:MAG: kinase to dihydroxyacetone kinase [Lachnospiraceae bacterium]|nr:kinase to dihydroxyacetone kinase [Lachnospiraceae bacterium]
MLEFIPTNANNCRLQSITSERIIPELKAAIKCVHEYKYDTQLLIEGKDLDEDVISDYFTENFKGDCLLAVGDEELIKIHFHTNEPWKVLEYCASLGEIHDIVVEDMDRQARGLKG